MGMRAPLIVAMVLSTAMVAPVAVSAPTPSPSPSPAPTRDPAYSSYADYYLRNYADTRPKQRPAEQNPYRFFNYYGYYQSRYGAGSDPYYYYGLYEAALSERYRRALGTQESPKPGLMNQAMRFWQNTATPQPKRTPHER